MDFRDQLAEKFHIDNLNNLVHQAIPEDEAPQVKESAEKSLRNLCIITQAITEGIVEGFEKDLFLLAVRLIQDPIRLLKLSCGQVAVTDMESGKEYAYDISISRFMDDGRSNDEWGVIFVGLWHLFFTKGFPALLGIGSGE